MFQRLETDDFEAKQTGGRGGGGQITKKKALFQVQGLTQTLPLSLPPQFFDSKVHLTQIRKNSLSSYHFSREKDVTLLCL